MSNNVEMKMKSLSIALALAGAATLGTSAFAADPVKSETPKVVQGVKLSAVCDQCGVVDGVRSETRKGKGSGVGAVGGAVAGGIIGHQFGGGTGKTAMTAVGAVGGGIAGNEIEKEMKKHTVWITTVTLKNGSKHRYENASAPAFKAGDVVRIQNGHPVKQAG